MNPTEQQIKGNKGRADGSRVVRLNAASLKLLSRYSSDPNVAIQIITQALEESKAMIAPGVSANLVGFDEKKFIEKLRPVIRHECEQALLPFVNDD